LKPGFSVVEAIAPCPTLFVRFNRKRWKDGDILKYYQEHSVIRHDAKPWEVDIGFDGEIVCGEFVNIERPTFQDRLREVYGELHPCDDLGLLHRPSAEATTSFEVEIELGEEKPTVTPAKVEPLVVGSAGQAEVRLGGFGGQGIILSGKIVGKAAALHDGREATLTQSYGPESRGGACSTALIISDGAITYPQVTRPAVMALMSQEAYTTYHGQLVEEGLLLTDADLVEPDPSAGQHVVPIPATRIAEQELGRRIVANIVMLGALTALSDVVSEEAMRQAVLDSVPKGTEELNMRAFGRGYEYARGMLGAEADASNEGKN